MSLCIIKIIPLSKDVSTKCVTVRWVCSKDIVFPSKETMQGLFNIHLQSGPYVEIERRNNNISFYIFPQDDIPTIEAYHRFLKSLIGVITNMPVCIAPK